MSAAHNILFTLPVDAWNKFLAQSFDFWIDEKQASKRQVKKV